MSFQKKNQPCKKIMHTKKHKSEGKGERGHLQLAVGRV